MIQEVFLETDWEEADQARAARDERATQLEGEGLSCSCLTLYRATDGRQVFLVEAQSPGATESDRPSTRQRSTPRQPRSKDNGPHKIEYR